jgi:tripartite-type tricarboxylate transporter receptor subunit TctC
MAESMKKTFTKGVAVLNRPGGGGSVGMAEVAQAQTRRLHRHPRAELDPRHSSAAQRAPYKTPDDYEPILNTITFYTLSTVKADAPWKTSAGVHGRRQGESRQDPRRLARGGDDQPPHARAVAGPGGFKTTHVPFSGWGETSPALLGGHIDAAMAQPAR